MQDCAQAAGWFRKAAEQGDEIAECNLGLLCASGDGVAQDQAEAVKWWRKAAAHDRYSGTPQHNLGLAYARGEGVVQDRVQALMWLSLAAAIAPRYDTIRDAVALK